jgi:uncharacterized protein (DUF362 family)
MILPEPNVHFDLLGASGYAGLSKESPVYAQALGALGRQIADSNKPVFCVFLLCNFVYHRRPSETQEAYDAKTTHPSVVRLALQALLEASGTRPVQVWIGNSPLQSASWECIIADSRLGELVSQFDGARPGFGVALADLRMNVQPRELEDIGRQRYDAQSDQIVQIDLARDSMLEGLAGNHEYRVLDYPEDRIRRVHAPGRHVYLVHRRILEADLIVSIPKLKTHEKVGMTTGIKGCVGIVAHKDCLAHHRVGAARDGGDEYPRHSRLRLMQTALHHRLYAMPLNRLTWLLRLLDRSLRKLYQLSGSVASGSWRGNDTAWRMSIDLARITLYGRADGTMGDTRQREHFLLTDGIVAGEGQGPLDPTPVRLGWLAFSRNLALGDLANALVMGFRANELPIVREALTLARYPIAEPDAALCAEGPDGATLDAAAFAKRHARRFRLPRGW